MLINFKYESRVLNKLGIFNGIYENFSVDWYRKVGAQYTMALLINAGVPLSELSSAIIAWY